jgi:hypothetical protein
MAPRFFNLKGLTLQAAVEAFLAARVLPEYLPEYLPARNAFFWLFLRLLLVNYAIYSIFWGLIYSYFVSPIRHFPSPQVGQDHMLPMQTD